MLLRILDLYSGIGGFSLAFERVNPEAFRTHAFCEIDKHAQQVLRKHWPLTPIFEDITKLNGNIFRNRIDIICGGSPCQDVSIAGKQKGLVDENGEITRSGLWVHYKRIIEEIRPKYVIIENVANLRNKGLATFIKDLSEIGYDCEWEIISARDVGAPHLRERIWIVAYPSNANNFRFWPTFATQEEKSEWWTKTASKFGTWWETEPEICRVANGLSGQMERNRREQIKRLGNAIVPSIVEIIAQRILEIENGYK